MKMHMKVQGIKIEIKDNKPQVLLEAIKVSNDHTATPLMIEKAMRALFYHSFISTEIIETYNKLEKTWKLLTNYKTNDNISVLWEE